MSEQAIALFALLCLNLSHVELELFALEDITITASALAWPRWNARCNTAQKQTLNTTVCSM